MKLQVVKEHYGHFAMEEATLRVRFGSSKITLDLPVDGLMTRDGWRITPRSYPTVRHGPLVFTPCMAMNIECCE